MSHTKIVCGSEDDPRCVDPEWAADHLDICPDAAPITGLRVAPAAGEVEVNSKYPFLAFLTFEDGREKNITTKAVWSSNNTGIADVDMGVCTGRAVGVVTIEATYRGYFDFGQLTVIAQCFQVGADIVLLFDRSASMVTPEADGTQRMEAVKAAAKAFIANCIFTKDQVAVISFAGIYKTSSTGVVTRSPDTTKHVVLSSSKPDVESAIDAVKVNVPCIYTLPDGGPASRCATAIGGGFAAAKEELLSSRARSGTRKIIVLLTDGLENICSPDPIVVSDEIKALNWVIVVIAANVPDALSVVCGVKVLSHTWLKSLCSCDFFFTAQDQGDLNDVYSRIPSIICHKQGDVCLYYLAPTSNPPVPTISGYCYTAFEQWNVAQGGVDLIGVDLWPQLAAGHGRVVSLGSSCSKYMPHIKTKTAWTLGTGRYQLSLSLAGNGRIEGGSDLVTVVILGANGIQLLNRLISVSWDQAFTQFEYTFSPSSPVTAGIHVVGGGEWPPSPDADPNLFKVGALIDTVKLTDLFTGAVIFQDSFDSDGG